MSEKRDRDFSRYEAMETEELEEILRLDAEAPEERESDTELLLYIMEVLANRNKNNVTGKTAQEAWESFQQNYLPQEEECVEYIQNRRSTRKAAPWLCRAIAAAAVIVVLICIPITARAFGWEKLWNVFATWAKDTVSFVGSEETHIGEPVVADDLEYTSLRDMLERNNRPSDMVPTWIPEGFVLESIEKVVSPRDEIYKAFYLNDERQLTIRVRSYLQEVPEKAEINEDLLEIYEVSGVQYYIFSNMGQMRAVWIVSSYQCNISGDLSLDEIKQMIDSIGKG